MLLPMTETPATAFVRLKIHPAFYVLNWIFFSSVVILFNKWIISTAGFPYPVFLTCWHLIFATIMTQVLARTTTLLDGRNKVKMTGRVYLRAIVPIGVFYSASLVCSNLTYLYLSVAFIQMLKAAAPAAVLLTSYAFGVASPSLSVVLNVLFIVFGVALASYGEVEFSLQGFLYQLGGLIFEAVRLVMVERLLTGKGNEDPDAYKMDPLVSLYYYAPVCAVMNVIVWIFAEMPAYDNSKLVAIGPLVLIANAAVAFLLNVASVFLLGKTSSLVLTLCGVLKNIGVVVVSVVIWGTIVSGLQVFGYTIATAGLIYYGLGYEGVRDLWRRTEAKYKQVVGANGATVRGSAREWRTVILCVIGAIFIFISVALWKVHGGVFEGAGEAGVGGGMGV